MAFASRNQKMLFKGLLAAAGGATAFAWFYPSTREIFYTTLQRDEADAFDVKRAEEAYQRLQKATECNSLLKKHLTRDVFDKLKYRKTLLGATLYDVIRSGVFNLDSSIGVYAADAESYKLFAPLFDPIIEDYHKFPKNAKQPPVDLGEDKLADFPPLDPDGKYIMSTRIRCGRTLNGYPFPPLLSMDDYEIIQQKVIEALKEVKDEELKGTYVKLKNMDSGTQKQLCEDHFLFKQGDRHLQHAQACKYWPQGRGIYYNKDKTFLIWVNEEDHLRLIAMQEGSDVGQVLDRLIRGIKAIESQLKFKRDDRLGWLTFCPMNLGSTIRASVHIYLPKLSARSDFKEICDSLNLQVRGIHGEHSESKAGVYDISNKTRLGITEYEAVKQMYDGVKELIRLEKAQK